MSRIIVSTVTLTSFLLYASAVAQTAESTTKESAPTNKEGTIIDDQLIRKLRAGLNYDESLSPQEKELIVDLASASKKTKDAVVNLIINDERFADPAMVHAPYLMKAIIGLDPLSKTSDQIFVKHVEPVIFKRDPALFKIRSAETVLSFLRLSDEQANKILDQMIKSKTLVLSDVTLSRILSTGTQTQLESITDLIIESFQNGSDQNYLVSIEAIGKKLTSQSATKYISRLLPLTKKSHNSNTTTGLGALLSVLTGRLDVSRANEFALQLIEVAKQDDSLLLEYQIVFQSLPQNTDSANILKLIDLYVNFAAQQTEPYPVSVSKRTISRLLSGLKQPELNTAAEQIFQFANKDKNAPASSLPEALYGHLKHLNDLNSSELVEYSVSTFRQSFRVQIQCDLLMELAPQLSIRDADKFAKHLARKFKYGSSNDYYKLSEFAKVVWKKMSLTAKDEFRGDLLKYVELSKNKKRVLAMAKHVAPFYPPKQTAGFSGIAKQAVEYFVSTSDPRKLFSVADGLEGIGPWFDQETALPLLDRLVDHLEEERKTTKFPMAAKIAIAFARNVDSTKLKRLFELIADRVLIENEVSGLDMMTKAIRGSASKWDPSYVNLFTSKLTQRMEVEQSSAKVAELAKICLALEPHLSIESKKSVVQTLMTRITDSTFAQNVIDIATAISGLKQPLFEAKKTQIANACVDGLANTISEQDFVSRPSMETQPDVRADSFANLTDLLQCADVIQLLNALKSPLIGPEVEMILARSLEKKAGQEFSGPKNLVDWAKEQNINLAIPFKARFKKKQFVNYPEFQDLVVSPVSHSDSPNQFLNFYMVDQIAYIAAATAGIEIIDLSNKDSQKTLSRTGLGQTSIAVFVVGDNAFVTSGPFGVPSAFLKVVDVSDKSEPKLTGKIPLPDYPSTVEVRDKLAYVADHSEGLRIIDVSDPANLKEIGASTSPGFILDVKLFGNYALLADKEVGLRVVDILDPTKPVQVGEVRTRGPALNLAISGKHVFVACGDKGVAVVDLSNPKLPKSVTTLQTELATSVSAEKDLLAVGALGLGCRIFDISDLSSPKEKRLKLKSIVNCVLLKRNRLFLTEINPTERKSYFRVYSLSRDQFRSNNK